MVESRSMGYRVQVLGALAVVALLVAWLGVPTFEKWRADRLVDELCAKDGGVTVYEKVTLSEKKFDKFGQIRVRDKRFLKPDDEYYSISDHMNIKGRRESDDIDSLVIYRRHYSVYRRSDNKLLGESVSYTRRGGDPIGPWHPSSFRCPRPLNTESKIFKSSRE